MKTKIFTLGLAFTLGLGSSVMAQTNTASVAGSAPKADFAGPNDALNPIPGKNYTYSVNVTNFATGTSTIHWIATQNTNLIDAFSGNGVIANDNSSLIVNTNTKYNDNTLKTAATNTVDIKWNSKILSAAKTKSLLVATKVEDCSNNIKVYDIKPTNGFMVDIKNVENATYAPLAYDATDNQCYDKVASATWDGTKMIYDYGTNVLYYEVVATYFSDEWVPTFNLTGLKGNQTATLEWSYNKYTGAAATSDYAAAAIAEGADLTTAPVKVASSTNTATGVSIYVKVTVKNNAYEGLTDDDIKLAVKGTVNGGAEKDQLATGGDGGYTDNNTTQTFLKRPTLTAASGAFTPEN